MKTICKCCGQTIKAAKIQPTAVTDTLSLSTADAFKYFKATAPVEDAKFFLRHTSLLTADQVSALESLIARPPARPEFYRRLRSIQDAWRGLSMTLERAERRAAQTAEKAA